MTTWNSPHFAFWKLVFSLMGQTQESGDSDESHLRANLIEFAYLLFSRMSVKYGGATTLNELVMLNYGFVCHLREEAIYVTTAASDLGMPKSTASRILTGMRAKGLVTEQVHVKDRRRRIFRLSDTYLSRGDDDIQNMLKWCAKPGNSLV